jgi:YidC/Oxa1 family membrane protein insertase
MDTQRVILLLIFTFSLVMLWDAWQRQHLTPPAAQNAGSTAAVPGQAAPAPTTTLTPSAAAVPSAPTASVPAGAAKAVVKTDVVLAEISAQGGDLVRLELLQHKANNDRSRNFVLLDSGEKHVYLAQSGLIGEGMPNHKTLYALTPGSFELKPGEDEISVRLEAPGPAGVKVAKTYTFRRGSYLIDVTHEIANTTAAPLAGFAYFQLTRDGKAAESETKMLQTFTGPTIFTEQEKFQKVDFGDVEKGKAKFPQKANNGWIGMLQHYFVGAWLPQGNAEREFFMRKVGDNLYSAGLVLATPAITAGSSASVTVPLFAGPQEQARLDQIAEKTAPGFNLVVDYGWLTIIAAPLFWVLNWLHGLVGNWGWAIILLTILIKLVFFPLSAASYKSMARMRVVTPKLMKIKELYGNDRQRMNQEMMELYKKEKINPLGGCLPILVQIPVFIALYWVLLGSVEMRQAPWLGWITDLSAKDPFFILPLIMGATMFIQMKLNPTPPDPIQAKVMMAMPIVFTVMFLWFPAGLVLYWTVNNILSIAQQWQITRMIEGGGKPKAAA